MRRVLLKERVGDVEAFTMRRAVSPPAEARSIRKSWGGAGLRRVNGPRQLSPRQRESWPASEAHHGQREALFITHAVESTSPTNFHKLGLYLAQATTAACSRR